MRMHLLAISGSSRPDSSNTLLLQSMKETAPRGVRVTLLPGLEDLPIYSPERDTHDPPRAVTRLRARVEQADGIVISSPEYVRSIPAGLKNAIEWLVSDTAVMQKPIALAHASLRGDDMLASLRLVLGTVSQQFHGRIFLRLPLAGNHAADIPRLLAQPDYKRAIAAFFAEFSVAISSSGRPLNR